MLSQVTETLAGEHTSDSMFAKDHWPNQDGAAVTRGERQEPGFLVNSTLSDPETDIQDKIPVAIK